METRNYSKFKFIETNRNLTERKVLKDSIIKYGYLKSQPITVNSDFKIIDGQNRFSICKELGLPIIYEISDIDANELMIVLNTTSAVWRLNEFIHHYAKRGFDGYDRLLDFIKQNPALGVTNCIAIFSNDTAKCTQIRNGLKLQELPNYKDISEFIYFFKNKFALYRTAVFVRAITKFYTDKTTEPKHIKRMQDNAYGLVQCATTNQYIEQFNKISKKKFKP